METDDHISVEENPCDQKTSLNANGNNLNDGDGKKQISESSDELTCKSEPQYFDLQVPKSDICSDHDDDDDEVKDNDPISLSIPSHSELSQTTNEAGDAVCTKVDEEAELFIGVTTPLQATRLNSAERELLYKNGQDFEKQGKKELALKCYLRCMMGVADVNGFPSILKCVHDTAMIYEEMGEQKKASQFLKAEALYRESEPEVNPRVKPEADKSQIPGQDSTYGPPTSNENEEMDSTALLKTADEYKDIAHFHLKKKLPNLALKYAAKSVEINQKVYGMRHPITLERLEFFSHICGEVGKQRLLATTKNDDLADVIEEDELLPSAISDPDDNDEVPKRKFPKSKKEVKFGDAIIINEQKPNWLPMLFLKIFLSFVFIVLSIFGLFMYCQNDYSNSICLGLNQHSKHLTFIELLRGIFTNAILDPVDNHDGDK